MKGSKLTLSGTVGGTFLSIIPNLSSEEVMRTIALAAIGAVASFIVSFLLKVLLEKHK